MLLVQTGKPTAERKFGVAMIVLYVLSGTFAALMTMHYHVRPSPPAPPGFRLFGLPRPRKRAAATPGSDSSGSRA